MVQEVLELPPREVAQSDQVLRSVGGGHGQRLAPPRRESTPRAELARHVAAFLDSPRAQGYNLPPHAPIAQLDRASDYGSEG